MAFNLSDTTTSDGFALSITKNGIIRGRSSYDATTAPSNEVKIISKYDSDATGGDEFGNSLAIGDGKLVVGAIQPTDGGRVEVYNLGDSAGANTDPYMYLYSPEAPTGYSSNYFGGTWRANSFNGETTAFRDYNASDTNLAVGGGRIAVAAGGFNDTDPGAVVTPSGALFVYDYNGNLLNTQYGIQSTGSLSERMGLSVAMGCGRIVCGAHNGYAGYSQSGGSTNFGNIYLFDMDGNRLKRLTLRSIVEQTNWDFGEKESFYRYGNGFFGKSVAVGHNKIVVGFPFGNAFKYDLNFPGYDEDWGCAVVLDLDGNLEYVIKPPTSGYFRDTSSLTQTERQQYYPMFGWDVAIGNGIIAVSGPDDITTSSSTIKGESDGFVFVYDLSGKLLFVLSSPLDTGSSADAQFGYQVQIADGRIYVSTSKNLSTNKYTYVYDLEGNLISSIVPSDYQTGDYPQYLAAGDGYLAIGAPGDDNANGTNGGAIYLYETPKQETVLDMFDKMYV